MFSEMRAHRNFIYECVKRDFSAKYKKSIFGGRLWLLFNSFAIVAMYTIVFADLMRDKLMPNSSGYEYQYSLYLCAGVITWNFFSEIAHRGLNIFLEYSHLIKKTNFPLITLPFIVILGTSINFAVTFSLFLVILLLLDLWPGGIILAVLPIIFIQIIFSSSVGLLAGVGNVVFRDVGFLFTILLNFWFWFTPIIYPLDILPKNVVGLLTLNPMLPIITSYQDILIRGLSPNWIALLYPLCTAIVLMLMLFIIFKKHSCEIIDEI